MIKKFEDIKDDIVASQLSQSYEKVLIDNMLQGKRELLSANDIIEMLGISSDEFKEMLDLPNHVLFASNARAVFDLTSRLNPANAKYELINTELKQSTKLPKPDIYIIGKARWAKGTIKNWLENQTGHSTDKEKAG
ncbi:hypothetical protein [Avibacterium paragallinarum]|uniref:Uncharacterized protein n=1 Tax=Avibacterium paragallinarum TaxID=728 RepID=A0A380X461_AVIPA|nr:hypothetical protein [Avibacterium paragallinarum]KAA6208070.1 hypothetical protein F1968_11305 [Avibacterium paragallinarum]RZN55136.1 hypothetical protein EIG79_11665 [Avibacterium paragallinarum]RZN68120.1 hypothetical protein EIG77_11475 [Avibacterium paragallinarum]SUU97564.1 Uncharacterised protein [Avibacterium paragallinarum]